MATNKTKKVNNTMRKENRKVRKRVGTRRRMHSNRDKNMFVKVFLEILNMVKLYHWRTRSYSEHKATDDLYSNLNSHMDTFVEILMGKDESRIRMLEKKIKLIDLSNTHDFKEKIYGFRQFLIDMNMHLNANNDSDLLNIRDEILGDINQFLYLLTLNK
jgi:hypothetical protein